MARRQRAAPTVDRWSLGRSRAHIPPAGDDIAVAVAVIHRLDIEPCVGSQQSREFFSWRSRSQTISASTPTVLMATSERPELWPNARAHRWERARSTPRYKPEQPIGTQPLERADAAKVAQSPFSEPGPPSS